MFSCKRVNSIDSLSQSYVFIQVTSIPCLQHEMFSSLMGPVCREILKMSSRDITEISFHSFEHTRFASLFPKAILFLLRHLFHSCSKACFNLVIWYNRDGRHVYLTFFLLCLLLWRTYFLLTSWPLKWKKKKNNSLDRWADLLLMQRFMKKCCMLYTKWGWLHTPIFHISVTSKKDLEYCKMQWQMRVNA